MKTFLGILILLAVLTLPGLAHAQISTTNTGINPLPDASNVLTNDDPILPLIKFQDVPITAAIESLARRLEINYIIDPQLFPATDARGRALAEPMVTFCLTNVGGKETLKRMLNLRRLDFVENPATHVARITRSGQPTHFIDASLLDPPTNSMVFRASDSVVLGTNDSISIICFVDATLDVALENLLRRAGVSADLNFPDAPPVLSVRWENVTAKQAVIALSENYNLSITKNEKTGIIQIKPLAAKKPPSR